jgi:MFS superfamily sulfate permease-like transporter
MAGIIHSFTLLCIVLFASPLIRFVPMAVLAGILMVVSYNMGEWREIPQLLKLTKTDVSVWLVTFALTVFADLTVAVEAGMILAALLFINRVAGTLRSRRSPVIMWKMAAYIFCKIKIFHITPPSSAFTVHSYSAQRTSFRW